MKKILIKYADTKADPRVEDKNYNDINVLNNVVELVTNGEGGTVKRYIPFSQLECFDIFEYNDESILKNQNTKKIKLNIKKTV